MCFKKRAFTAVLIVLIIIIATAVAGYPHILKISIDFPFEEGVHVYLADAEGERIAADYTSYENQTLLTYVDIRALEQYDTLLIKPQTMEADSQITFGGLKIALGDTVFIDQDPIDRTLCEFVDVDFDEGRQILKDPGEDPCVRIGGLKALYDSKSRSILKDYCLSRLGLFLWVSLLVVLYFDIIIDAMKAGASWIKAHRYHIAASAVIMIISLICGRAISAIYARHEIFRSLRWGEVFFIIVTEGVFACIISARIKHPGNRLIALITGGVGIFIIYLSLSAFMAADEIGAINEQLRDRDALRHWYGHTSHMNYVIMGTVWKILGKERAVLATGLGAMELSKLIHTFIGMIFAILAVDMACSRLIEVNTEAGACSRPIDGKGGTQTGIKAETEAGQNDFERAILYGSMLFFLCTMPSVVYTLKTYTYDTFAAIPGLYAGICAMAALKEKRRGLALIAVVISAFAIYEKIIAVVVLLVSGMILTAIEIWMLEGSEAAGDGAKCVGSRGVGAIFAGSKSIGAKGRLSVIRAALFVPFSVIAAGMCTVSYYYGVICGGKAPIADLGHVFVKLRKLFIPLGKRFEFLMDRPVIGMAGLCAVWMMIFIIAGYTLYIAEKRIESMPKERQAFLYRLCAGALLAFIVVGTVMVFLREDTMRDMKGYLPYTKFVMAQFVRHVPSVVMIFSIVFIVFACMKILQTPGVNLLGILTGSIGMTFASMYTVRWNVVWFKYMNIFMGLYAISIVAVVFPIIFRMLRDNKKLLGGIVSVFFCLQLLELSGSMPAISYFAPFWYPATAISIPKEDRQLVVYSGDNTMHFGMEIEDICREEGLDIRRVDEVRFYPGYDKGWWLNKPAGMDIAPQGWSLDKSDCTYTDRDFYEIDAHSIIHEDIELWGWPEAEPLKEEYYRGYLTARIYRGSDIEGFFGK